MRLAIAVVAAALLAALSACSSTPPATAAGNAAPGPAPVRGSSAPVAVAKAQAPEAVPARAQVPSAPPQPRSVYFAYDSTAVDAKYRDVVDRQAVFLRANPRIAVRLEGNGDERGSREYNLALGQRRAEAVGRLLELSGVDAARIEATSYGEEKPRALEHNEAAWAENRRVDCAYPNPK